MQKELEKDNGQAWEDNRIVYYRRKNLHSKQQENTRASSMKKL